MVAVTDNYYHKAIDDNSDCYSSRGLSMDIDQNFDYISSAMKKLDKSCNNLLAVGSQIDETGSADINPVSDTDTDTDIDIDTDTDTDTADNVILKDSGFSSMNSNDAAPLEDNWSHGWNSNQINNDISNSIAQLNMLSSILLAEGSQENDNDIPVNPDQDSDTVDNVILKETDFSKFDSLAVLMQKLAAFLTKVQNKNAEALYQLKSVQAKQSLVQLKNFVDKSLESANSQFTGSILSAVGGAVSGLASAAGNMVTPQVELGPRQGFAAASLGGHTVAAGFNIAGASYQAKASKQKTDSDVRQSNAQQLSSDASASTQKADASRDALASMLNQLLQGLQGVMNAMATR